MTDKEILVRPDRLERPTFWFVARRSIQLSYGRIDRQNRSTILNYHSRGNARIVFMERSP